jgi:hypothetical protein
MWVEIEISKPSAPKGQQNSAQGFNPGLGYDKRCALKALPTPRTRGAIPNWRSTPTLQHSNTPSLRVAGFEDEDDDEDENEAPHEWRQNVITQRIATLDGPIA